jgi:hypothetical protein
VTIRISLVFTVRFQPSAIAEASGRQSVRAFSQNHDGSDVPRGERVFINRVLAYLSTRLAENRLILPIAHRRTDAVAHHTPSRSPDMTTSFFRTGRCLLAFIAIGVTTPLIRDVRSDDDKPRSGPNPIEGAWKHVVQKNGNATEHSKLPEGQECINCITGGRFIWAIVKEGKLIASVGGKYKVDKRKYSEIIEFVYGDTFPESFKGSTFEFTANVDGDTWHKVGTIQLNGRDFKIDEKWERCK